MKKYLRVLFAVALLAGSALASAPGIDGNDPNLCPPGTICNPAA